MAITRSNKTSGEARTQTSYASKATRSALGFKKILSITIIFMTILVFPFQNCSKKKASDQFASKYTEDERLIELMNDANLRLNDLRLMVGSDAQHDGDNLEMAIKELERLVFEIKLPSSHPLVLQQMIYVVNGISDAGDLTLQTQIDALVQRVVTLEDQMADLLVKFPAFQELINSRLTKLQIFTEGEFALLHAANVALAEELNRQKVNIDDMLSSNDRVLALQHKLCRDVDTNPEVIACERGPELNQLLNNPDNPPSNCNCVSLSNLDCTQMFPAASDTGPRSQCLIMMTAIKNHDEQLKEIHTLNALQTKAIEDLVVSVENVNAQVDQVITELRQLSKTVEGINARLMVVEFKASRSEGAAGLSEWAKLTHAWIKVRTNNVSYAFCHKKKGKALDLDDYEVARHTYSFCHERLALLKQASAKVYIAEALIEDGKSINIEVNCDFKVGGTAVDQLDSGALIQAVAGPDYGAIRTNCKTGKAAALGAMINAASVLQSVAPDFRTLAHLANKAPFAQRLSLNGRTVSEFTASGTGGEARKVARKALLVPTHRLTRDSYYGQIERLFKVAYYKKVHRLAGGAYAAGGDVDLRTVQGLIQQTWTHQEINGAATTQLGLIKQLEIAGACGDLCGWRVVRRESNASSRNPRVDKNGKKFFSFPRDPVAHCPIENQHVVQAGVDSNVGKNYIWSVNYSDVWERHREVLAVGEQRQIGPDPIKSCSWEIVAMQPFGQRLTGKRAQCIQFQAFCIASGDAVPATLDAGAVVATDQDANFAANPLGPRYWVYENSAPASYGDTLAPLSKQKPFYGQGAFANQFIR